MAKHDAKYVAKYSADKKRRRPMFLSIVLYALVATVIFSGVTFSRYTATVTSYDSAKVAVIALSQDVYTQGACTSLAAIDFEDMYPGCPTKSRYIKIRSTSNINGTGRISDVDQVFDINISSFNNLPLTYTLSGYSRSNTQTCSYGTISASSTNLSTTPITVTDGSLPYGDNEVVYVLSVDWPAANNNHALSTETERVTIKVTSEQK